MPIRYIECGRHPKNIEADLRRLDEQFPGWDFWWVGKYCAGRTGELGCIKDCPTPDDVAEQVREKENSGYVGIKYRP